VRIDVQGSAHQHIEKGIAALSNHEPQGDYTDQRKVELEAIRKSLEMNVKGNNLKQLMAEKEKRLNHFLRPRKNGSQIKAHEYLGFLLQC
jgi:hypothetical protein